MANVKLIFYSTESSGFQTELSCSVNKDTEVYIDITSRDDNGGECNYTGICLDKSTAIKLSKILKTAINEIE